MTLKIIFWLLVFYVLYAYFIYVFILYLLTKIKLLLSKNNEPNNIEISLPEITLFVAAYNEKDYIKDKINNHFNLDYPQHLIKHLWVTDGSNDGTPDLLREYKNITVLHKDKREGKTGAINRGYKYITTPITIFSDSNTMLNKDAIKNLVKWFDDPSVGCVAGEKRIVQKKTDIASASGEGFYWKYESKIKKLESDLHSVVGAVGELYAIRTELINKIPHDTILDDFVISSKVIEKGYTIKYEPNAYAVETASANIKEELKRKIRIAAGGIQTIIRLKHLLNPFKYGIFSWEFLSHKVSRWIIVPFILPILYILNIIIIIKYLDSYVYLVTFIIQTLFYILAIIGSIIRNKQLKHKVIFIPYYIFIMHYAAWLGLFKYLKGQQSVNWEKAKRA